MPRFKAKIMVELEADVLNEKWLEHRFRAWKNSSNHDNIKVHVVLDPMWEEVSEV